MLLSHDEKTFNQVPNGIWKITLTCCKVVISISDVKIKFANANN